jgi:hypothetical protein
VQITRSLGRTQTTQSIALSLQQQDVLSLDRLSAQRANRGPARSPYGPFAFVAGFLHLFTTDIDVDDGRTAPGYFEKGIVYCTTQAEAC